MPVGDGEDAVPAGGPDGAGWRRLDRVAIVLPARTLRHARNL